MTNKSSITAVVLAGLTLGSFALVSSYVSKTPNHPTVSSASPAPSSTTAPAAATSPAPKTAEGKMYKDLGDAVTLLDQVRGAVLASDWPGAQSRFDEFTRAAQQLPAPQLNQPDFSPVLQDFFTLYRVELARALREQNSGNARFALNQLFAIVSELRARLGTRGLPLELVRLNFLVREVELWSQLNNATLLGERVKALRETWQELRPVIAARRNGRETAARFDALVERIVEASRAATPELSALMVECNQELEQMDSLFRRPPRAAGPNASPGTAGKNVSEED